MFVRTWLLLFGAESATEGNVLTDDLPNHPCLGRRLYEQNGWRVSKPLSTTR